MALTRDLSNWKAGPIGRMPTDQPVAANAKWWTGSIIGYNAAGFLDTVDNAAAGNVVGIAPCAVDNTGGADDALRAQIILEQTVDLAAGVIVMSDVGGPIFASDDNTLQIADNGKLVGSLDAIRNGFARIRIG